MKDSRIWISTAVLGLVALAVPLGAQTDFVCPLCDTEAVPLQVAEVVELVLTTVLQKGVSILLLAATAVVSLPWIIAGVAVAAFYVPRWIRASS